MIKIDPTGRFQNYPPNYIQEGVGYIPQFISEADPAPFCEQLEAEYMRFANSHCHWAQGHKMDGLMFLYPGDPPLAPLLILERNGQSERVIIYEHAVVVYQDDYTAPGKWCRMD